VKPGALAFPAAAPVKALLRIFIPLSPLVAMPAIGWKGRELILPIGILPTGPWFVGVN
jgi:hypothetical protein